MPLDDQVNPGDRFLSLVTQRFLFGFVNTCIGALKDLDCSTGTIGGYTVKDWILMYGAIDIFLCLMCLIWVAPGTCSNFEERCKVALAADEIVVMTLGLIMWVIGAVLVFDPDNLKCLGERGDIISWAMFIWLLITFLKAVDVLSHIAYKASRKALNDHYSRV